jgi:hypothetical protein
MINYKAPWKILRSSPTQQFYTQFPTLNHTIPWSASFHHQIMIRYHPKSITLPTYFDYAASKIEFDGIKSAELVLVKSKLKIS